MGQWVKESCARQRKIGHVMESRLGYFMDFCTLFFLFSIICLFNQKEPTNLIRIENLKLG